MVNSRCDARLYMDLVDSRCADAVEAIYAGSRPWRTQGGQLGLRQRSFRSDAAWHNRQTTIELTYVDSTQLQRWLYQAD